MFSDKRTLNNLFLPVILSIGILLPLLCMSNNSDVRQSANIDYVAANDAIFEKYSIDELKAQVEYEKLNSNRLEQELQQVKSQLIQKKVENRETQKYYLLALAVFCVLISGAVYKWNKAIQADFSIKLDAATREFEKERIRAEARLTLTTIEKERERIARNLHDGISNNLVSLRLQLQSISNAEPGKDLLVRLTEITHREVRAIMHNLSTPAIDNLMFEQLFYNHIEIMNFKETLKVEGILIPESGWEIISKQMGTEIYRLLQEITGNIVKHSGAKNVNVTLRRDDDGIVLLAEDNGIGINEINPKGFGMKNLKTRVELLRGQLHVDSVPKEGTVIRVKVPFFAV